jgi:transposase
MRFYAGLDWASAEHAVCVIDEMGKVKTRFTVAHTASGMQELVDRLAKHAEPAEVLVAIERPSGIVVDTLVDAGFPVVPIHPNVVVASRARYSAAGAKSDASDAFMLADLLRTDGHRFKPLTALSDETRALRALVRSRDALVEQRIASANQLRTHLESYWPGAVVVFAEIHSPIALAFVGRYPTAASANDLDDAQLNGFLREHRYTGRRTAQQLLQRLAEAPITRTSEKEIAAKATITQALVSVLRTIVVQLSALTSTIEAAIAAHADGTILMSFPRAGRINAAQILAELGDDRARFVSEEHLAAEAGVAPVTRASGKHRHVSFRFACNGRLRRAVTCFADNSRHSSPWAADVYRRARARGCDHPHATRILARAWLRVLWRCWQSKRPYEPMHHTAAAKLRAASTALTG